MANNFNLTLDTTAPASPVVSIEAGATFTATQLVNIVATTSDGSTVGYSYKIWGDVDGSNDVNVQPLEANSAWIAYTGIAKQIRLSNGDGTKNIFVKIRDDVWNPSSQATDTIVLDASLPVATCSAPDVTKISKQTGKRTCTFTFQADSDFSAYKVKVGASGDHTTGTQLLVTNGSTNVQGSGVFTTATVTTVTIDGADLEVASAGDGAKTIKVFVQETSSGNWSA